MVSSLVCRARKNSKFLEELRLKEDQKQKSIDDIKKSVFSLMKVRDPLVNSTVVLD